MNSKIFLRYLYIPVFDDREKIRVMLNDLGFYAITIVDGLEVSAIRYETSETLVAWFEDLVKGVLNGH